MPIQISRTHAPWAALSLFLASAALLQGCVVAPSPPHHAPRPTVLNLAPQIRTMPEVIVENPGRQPAPNWHWVKGYWQWHGDQWQWQPGHWVQQAAPPMPEIIVETRPMAPSPQHYWVPGHWVWRAAYGNWNWVNGRWYP